MFDTDQYFVICSNVIGGCQGSTGPSSLAPDGRPYALRFPAVTIADMVQAQRHLLDALGIERIFAVVGGSMGAMQALQWAVDTPERVENVLFLASTPRSSAQQIAFNETGRQAIYADPYWNNGDYYGGPAPVRGLAVARMVAHITYMSDLSMETKFGRRLQDAIRCRTLSTGRSSRSKATWPIRASSSCRFDANSYCISRRRLTTSTSARITGRCAPRSSARRRGSWSSAFPATGSPSDRRLAGSHA